jgi:chromosomal replication initiation ATPase DnaA
VQSAEQLLLDLGHRTALSREDFLIAPGNEDAVAWVDLWPEWSAPALILYGPAACGKTHLASVWQAKSGALWLKPKELMERSADAIAGEGKHLVVDHADSWIGDRDCETVMFHLYNIFKEEKRSILFTMRKAPVRQGFVIKDLASRLRAAPAVGILAPDDCLLAAVLVKMFADRQLKISSEVLDYTLPRIERSFDCARKLVEVIDKTAMRKKRPVSVPLVREILLSLDECQEAAADCEDEAELL